MLPHADLLCFSRLKFFAIAFIDSCFNDVLVEMFQFASEMLHFRGLAQKSAILVQHSSTHKNETARFSNNEVLQLLCDFNGFANSSENSE